MGTTKKRHPAIITAKEMRQHSRRELTLMLEKFLEEEDYDGHKPVMRKVVVDGRTEVVSMVHLHEPIDGLTLVFMKNPSLGRTYGALNEDTGQARPMSLVDIVRNYKEPVIRHMACKLSLGMSLDGRPAFDLSS